MDCFTSTIQDYQPILVGAGCLALGYMCGRRCRFLMENQGDIPTTSEAACCAQIESFSYVSDHAAVNPETMAVQQRPASSPKESDLDYFEREPEGCIERDPGQLEIFDPHDFHKMLKPKEDMIRAKTAFKRQKSAPVRREVVRAKADSEQDSDDKILARRLEHFTNYAPGKRASINMPGGSDLFILRKKKKPTMDVTTSCAALIAQELPPDSEKIEPKGPARSCSGLGALATPHIQDQGDDNLEDTCKSPKTVRRDCSPAGDDDDMGDQDKHERGLQVELTLSAPHIEPVAVPCAISSSPKFANTSSSDPSEEGLVDGISLELMDSDDLNMHENEADDVPDARMELSPELSALNEAHPAMHQSREDFVRLALPTSPPPGLLHVQNRCVGKQEVPTDQVLKAELYELLHAADCRKRGTSRWCFGKRKPLTFRWFGKLSVLTRSWRKRKLWRRRNKALQLPLSAQETFPNNLKSQVSQPGQCF